LNWTPAFAGVTLRKVSYSLCVVSTSFFESIGPGATRGLSRYADEAISAVLSALRDEHFPRAGDALEEVLFGVTDLNLDQIVAANSDALTRRTLLVVQYPVAPIPLGVLGNPSISSPVDADSRQLAQKGCLLAGLGQCRGRVRPDLTQTGHSRTLFVYASPLSTLLKKPKSRGVLCIWY